jgi:hypothetical protein
MRRTGLLLSLLTTVGLALLGGASAASAAQRAVGWGNYAGTGASPFDVPALLPGLEEPVTGAVGGEHSLALLADGTVMGWGTNVSGDLGSSPGYDELPVAIVESLSDVTALAASNRTSYALMQDGTVMAWGSGSEGELGDGSKTTAQQTPVAAQGLEGVTAIAAGGTHALALLEDGTVMQWGAWYSSGAQTTPVAVPGLTDVTAIAVGSHAAYALLADGTVEAWGYNEEGALGNSTPEQVLVATPAAVEGLAEVQAIAAGGNSAIALREDGTVLDWGSNEDGKLGKGTYGDSHVPVHVEGLSDAKAVAMGGEATFALLKDGSLLGWGGGGVMGAGDFDQHLTPVPVCGGKGVSAVFSGGEAREGNEPGETTAFAIGAPGPLCPAFDSTKPAWGTAGTTLTLEGINLEDVSSVLVGGSPASITFVSPKEIHAQVPPGSGDVSITGVGPVGSFGSQSGGLFDYVEAPSFGACVRTVGVEIPEEFSNNQCTTRGSGGGYEWEPFYDDGLASVSKKSVVLETAGVKVTCKTETGKGGLTSNKTAGSLVWTLAGCERLTQPCSSSGAPSGIIVTEALQGSIAVYKPGAKGDKVKDKAGLVISSATEGPVAQFSCGGTSIVVSGSVIGMLPTNKEKPRLALKFAVKKGGQEPSGVPGGPSHLLSASVGGGSPQATTITGTINLTIDNVGPFAVNTIAYD